MTDIGFKDIGHEDTIILYDQSSLRGVLYFEIYIFIFCCQAKNRYMIINWLQEHQINLILDDYVIVIL